MHLYARMISEATKITDPEKLAQIEDLMRDYVEGGRCLDNLTKSRFVKLAKEAAADIDITKQEQTQ